MKDKNSIRQVGALTIAEEAGICPGDQLISINGESLEDILDYYEWMATEELTLSIRKPDGEIWEIDVLKEPGEDIGLVFERPLMDKERSCTNQCIFCFVDQLPPNVRGSLHYKDDDWRLSFLMGNYITLTNLTDKDVRRIIQKRTGPLYVSVHTTNPILRDQMLGSKRGGAVLAYLKAFGEANISVHCQIVLCPGYNDGQELDKTLQDLFALRPSLQSVAVVPVGLTGHREGLAVIEPFTRERAATVIEQITEHQANFRAEGETAFVYAADEFYLLAGMAFPPYEEYDDFPQIENGVGLSARFIRDVFEAMRVSRRKKSYNKAVTVVTGVSAYPLLLDLTQAIAVKYGITIHTLAVPNVFFGGQVTVAGLVTGGDILKALENKDLGDKVLLPQVMLRKGEDIFLDDMPLKTLQQSFKTPLKVIPVEGRDFLKEILT